MAQLLNQESVSLIPSSPLLLSKLSHAENYIWICSNRLYLLGIAVLSSTVRSTRLVLDFEFLEFRSILCNMITSASLAFLKRTSQLKFKRVNQNQVGICVISTQLHITAVVTTGHGNQQSWSMIWSGCFAGRRGIACWCWNLEFGQ